MRLVVQTAQNNPLQVYIWEKELADYDTQHKLEQKAQDTEPEEKNQDEVKASKAKAKKAAKSGGKDKGPRLKTDFEDDG